MTVNMWLCPKQNTAIPLEECKNTPCNERKKCPIYQAVAENQQPNQWERKLPIHHAWTSAIINLSLRTLNRSRTVNITQLQKKHHFDYGLVVELDLPNCGYRGYFFLEDGHATVLSNGMKPDCVMLTSWQVLKQLYNGWTTVFDFQLQKNVKIPYNPKLAFSWDHIQLIKLNTDKNVYSAAYLFADELYQVAFPIIREQAKLNRLI